LSLLKEFKNKYAVPKKAKAPAKVTFKKASAPAKISFKGFGANAPLQSVKLTKPKKLVHKNIKLKLATQKITIPIVKVKKYKTLTSGVKLV